MTATEPTSTAPATGDQGQGQANTPGNTGPSTQPTPKGGANNGGRPPETGGSTTGADDVETWKARAREWEKRSKENADARNELDALKAAQMTEQQKLEARAKEAEARAERLEREQTRARIAAEFKLPLDAASRIIGNTEDEMREDAPRLAQLLGVTPNNGGGGTTPPRPDLGQGNRGGPRPPTADDWLRSTVRARRGG